MSKFMFLPIALMCAAPVAAATKTNPETAAVMAAVNKMFVAFSAQDEAGLVAAAMPDARATATFTTPSGEHKVSSHTWAQHAGAMAKLPEKPIERLGDAKVFVDGSLASVWVPYSVGPAGKIVQCGTNHFDMVKTADGWKINNVSWTQRRIGCPTK
jgi:hypothetical protein